MRKIRVVDALGNNLHETYDKRANGMVKKGRAYFMDTNTICLIGQTKEIMMETITVQTIIERLDTIMQDKEHIKEAMLLMERIPNDIDTDAVQARSEAIKDIVKQREETNRKMIDLLETMYPSM